MLSQKNVAGLKRQAGQFLKQVLVDLKRSDIKMVHQYLQEVSEYGSVCN